jgi:DNA replication protein DnaC
LGPIPAGEVERGERAGYKLLIIDELGYVPLSQTGAELLFEVSRLAIRANKKVCP